MVSSVHQGRAGTSGSVAAVPVLVDFAAKQPPTARASSLVLIGAIAADADRASVPEDARARFDAAMSSALDLALETLRHTPDEDDFAVVLITVAAAEGCTLLARELFAFVDREIQMECPSCDTYLTIATDDSPWIVASDDQSMPVGPVRDEAWRNLARFRMLAAESKHEALAAWIEGLRREASCPHCKDKFVIANALVPK